MTSKAVAAFTLKGLEAKNRKADAAVSTVLKKKHQDTTLSFAFTDATLKDLKGGKDIVIGAEQKLGDGVKGAVAYNVGQKNGEASLTVDRKVGGNDLSLKAIYHQKGDVFILEESWKFDKNNKLSGTYNFQTEAATFTYTHIQGPWTAEGKYDFARDAPTLTVKRKQGKATLSAAYGLKDQAAALTWEAKPFKVVLRSKVGGRGVSGVAATLTATKEFEL